MSSPNVHKNHRFILIIAQIHRIWMLFQKSSSSGAWIRVKNRSPACSLLYIQPHQPTLKKLHFRILSWQKANTTDPLSLDATCQEHKRLANTTAVGSHEILPRLSSQPSFPQEWTAKKHSAHYSLISACPSVVLKVSKMPHSSYTLSISVQELLSNQILLSLFWWGLRFWERNKTHGWESFQS